VPEPIKTPITANGEAIQRLRIARGWTLKQLAEKPPRCSEKTIRSAEQSKPMQMFTLKNIATKLGVNYTDIVTGIIPPEPEKPKVRTWEFKVTVSTPYEEFDEADDLLKFMSLLMKRIGGEPMELTSVSPGSTEITVKMTHTQIEKFIFAYVRGELDDLNIDSVKAPWLDGPSGYFDATKSNGWEYLARLPHEPHPSVGQVGGPLAQGGDPEESLEEEHGESWKKGDRF
jgi:transcriptional regulator with XRE-family HTH domain